jgi:hypothetical protein
MEIGTLTPGDRFTIDNPDKYGLDFLAEETFVLGHIDHTEFWPAICWCDRDLGDYNLPLDAMVTLVEETHATQSRDL